MSEGVSGIVSILEEQLGEVAFKEFKAPYKKNEATYIDYENEVATLDILSGYQKKLPFEVSTLLDHSLYEDRDNTDSPIGFIKMSSIYSPFSGRDLGVKAESIYKKQAKEAGKTAAKLHSVEIDIEDQRSLKRDPIDVKVMFLKKHPMASENEALIDYIIGLLRSMEGEKVFVHNDFHSANLFVGSMGGEIKAACDFCYSGMAVREMDFSFYTNYRDDFIAGYESINPNALNADNLDVLNAMELVFKKLNTDLAVRDTLEALK